MNIIGLLRRCHNWDDFKTHLQPLKDKEKGDCFEALTEYFLHLDPKYATKLKKVWNHNKGEVPSRIQTYLNLPGPDEGIDLVAKTKDGEYWAIQCKYREDETKSLGRKELSTFTDLAFTICRRIALGLVCTTADRFSHKLTLYGERLTFCTGDRWRELDAEFFRRLHRLLDRKVVPLKAHTPRPHQQQAIRNAYAHFVKERNTRGKLIMPCATGKSLTGYWIAEKLGARSILIAVPSLALIRQTLEVWARESVARKRDVQWIAVCSDESVRDIDRDDAVVLTQDLGIRVHTDPIEIARWLKARKRGATVVFTTYQSGRSTAKAARRARKNFDVGILDEAHKTVGRRDSLFSHLLFNKNIAIKKRIFMTATERHYRGESNEIASMNDPNLYGDTFEMLSFKTALESKPPILSDYNIVTMSVTRDQGKDLIKRNLLVKPEKGKWDADLEAQMLASVIALRKTMKMRPIRHAVSFHSSIARARAYKANQDVFSREFPKYRKLETFHVYGAMPTSVRKRQMDEFVAARRSLVTNARCLTEGVDVPDIDAVMFADPKGSTVDIVQAVGRALRPAKGKRLGYVVVPVFQDKRMKDRESQRKAFDSILMILRALAANDERIIEYFRTISEGRKWKGMKPFSIHIPKGVVVDVRDFIRSIEVQFWSRLAKLSWRPFEEARKFVRGLGLGSQAEWFQYCRGKLTDKEPLPADIPVTPHRVYEDSGWSGYGDWVGTGTIAPFERTYRPFRQARAFALSLGLKGEAEWRQYCKGELPDKEPKPDDIPANPARVYQKQGWKGWGDWLGTGTVATIERRYRPFKQARKFAQSLGLHSQSEWKQYVKGKLPGKPTRPKDIPKKPAHVYAHQGWVSWGDWLGTGTIATLQRKYSHFKRARKFVRSLGLRSVSEWRKWVKGELPGKPRPPKDILVPANPDRTYKDKGWKGYPDWLGYG